MFRDGCQADLVVHCRPSELPVASSRPTITFHQSAVLFRRVTGLGPADQDAPIFSQRVHDFDYFAIHAQFRQALRVGQLVGSLHAASLALLAHRSSSCHSLAVMKCPSQSPNDTPKGRSSLPLFRSREASNSVFISKSCVLGKRLVARAI